MPIRQAVRHGTLTPEVIGSNPIWAVTYGIIILCLDTHMKNTKKEGFKMGFKANNVKKSDNVEFCDITTQEVEKYLQEEMTLVTNAMRSKGLTNEPYVKVQVATMEFRDKSSKFGDGPKSMKEKFYPLLLILSPDVMDNYNTKRDGNDIFFNSGSDEDDIVSIKPPYYMFLKKFIFRRGDVNKGEDNDLFSLYNIFNFSVRDKSMINKLVVPRKDKGTGNVILLVNPINVFHDMLEKSDRPQERYQTSIKRDECRWLSNSTGSMMYHVCRKVIPKDNNGDGYTQLKRILTSMNK